MANLKDLIVNGVSRFVGKIYANGGIEGTLHGDLSSTNINTNEITTKKINTPTVESTETFKIVKGTSKSLDVNSITTKNFIVENNLTVGKDYAGVEVTQAGFSTLGSASLSGIANFSDTSLSGKTIYSTQFVTDDITMLTSVYALSADKGRQIEQTKVTFTYIVDSDESLTYWLSNKVSGKTSGGSDFSSVLIKSGEWTFIGDTKALDTLGTKLIVGECNAIIHYIYNATSTVTENILWNNDINSCIGIYNVSIIGELKNTATPPVNACTLRAFYKCQNLYNCKVLSLNSGFNSGGGFTAISFYYCNNLHMCSTADIKAASGGTYGFYYCNNLVQCSSFDTPIYHFGYCNDLLQCTTSTTGSPSNIGGYVIGYNRCSRLSLCYAEAKEVSIGNQSDTGYTYCTDLVGCNVNISISAGNGNVKNYGFDNCTGVIGCNSDVQVLTSGLGPYVIGYNKCKQVIACRGEQDTISGHKYLASGCKQVGYCYTNTSGNNYEIPEKNYASYDASGSYVTANTSNGGFNKI